MKILVCGITLVMLCITTGCGSSSVERTVYPPPPGDVKLSLKRTTSGDVNIDLSISGTGADTSRQVRFVRNIVEVKTTLYHPEQGMLDSLTYFLASGSSGQGDQKTMTIEALGYWTNSLGLAFDSLYTITTIKERGGAIYGLEKGFSLPPRDEKQQGVLAVVLKGWVENVTDTSALFVALAERRRMLDNEYFPTSERLRLIITDEDGTTYWNSSQVQIFMQMTAPVEPKNVDAVKRYETLWEGRDMQGNPLPPGHYTATLSLPVRPSHYVVTIPFNWKIPDDK